LKDCNSKIGIELVSLSEIKPNILCDLRVSSLAGGEGRSCGQAEG
jgi:hypothetical protein